MSKLPFEKIEREIVVREEAESENGSDPYARKVEDLIDYGIIILNKPQGPTSHQVSDYVKKILKLKKAGHSGTLDPNVCGVLPVALNKVTRIVQVLLNAGKEYICLMHLHSAVPEEKIKAEIEKYVGEIDQLPPIKSAVKRQWRKRNIYYLEVLEIDGQDVLFKMGCQAGTYVRKYCHDFGKRLNVGAHMQELVRTKAGPFKFEQRVSLHDLKDAYDEYLENGSEEWIRKCILPVEVAVSHLGSIWVHDSAVDSLAHGAQLSVPGVVKFETKIKRGNIVAVFTLKGELVCIGKAKMNSDDMKREEKGVCVAETKVFIPRGVYPKWEKNI
ncbi:RNA-guided pseudouridylation complex pseudouridine synthase subunit Cbf5 [archaeon]|jgi:H/ACA ribonucleoprotein complex subunit 4|nr:RNA-guided pseudouridylation complex pseudouridine synthase subunit Cbf5 [archaeon]MBT4416473.1 RNA-guided pseudouridylation complex pseudouridine synthase subunit Cbf5 [archaeon]